MSISPRHHVLRARVSGPAFRFALLLRDFGHLDDAGLSQLLLAAAEEQELIDEPEVEIDVHVMRRAAARLLFEQGAQESVEGRSPLVEDWPLLFS